MSERVTVSYVGTIAGRTCSVVSSVDVGAVQNGFMEPTMREYTSSQFSRGGPDGSVPPYMDPCLLSSIVHDFNNLLTPVVIALEDLQRRRAGTSRELGKIDAAIYCAFRAKVVARQLLEFANARPPRPEPTDIRQLLEQFEVVLANVLAPDIRLTLHFAGNLPLAFIDRELVERALLNLVLNARDAMPAGGEISLATALEFPPTSKATRPQRMIRLSVCDSGVGMDDRTLKMAGQKNFSTKANGSGLGLAVVRRIVESLSGGLSIISALGHGTTIDLWLPAISADSSK
ncbi:MAG: HAMP domain-containing histidine kinase [Mesorhizobium sp.]|nr:MAG: HAMP domain-containing histidine kinase [Mesorhizobium sp.]RWB95444.1 MAG: HAMP domain-containing histidine kinase [Mesorhizobium sp.]RWG81123.1 MAG: HAMP domain-containing histidine kinase [Mesorhizobium sp.]RWK15210.1 MAG: HAMP domain-containing histidine kinase [Mesorhizobium sp.]